MSEFKSVLLLSIDGLRASDLADPKLQQYLTNINGLKKTGVTFTNAFTSVPSDSFPGELNYLTGASPKTTGVYYDDSYSRTLYAPSTTLASIKAGTAVAGTEVAYDESIDKNPDLISGGGGIDPTKLPVDSNGNPVYPHTYLKVNTIFNVAKAAGLHTAFSDKHPAYDIANGSPGNGIDDLYTPEINAKVALENGVLVDASTAKNPSALTFKTTTTDLKLTEANDDLKVKATLNEIAGKNSTGTTSVGTPSLFGMNFQALSVAQKDASANGGIALDGTPSAGLIDALKHTDASIGQIVDSLKQRGLFDSTEIVLTAKHGQNPRLGQATTVPSATFTTALSNSGIDVKQATQDDVALFWLADQSKTAAATTALKALNNPSVDSVLSGSSLQAAGFGNPLKDDRSPDLVIKLKPGYVITNSTTKRAEHGGFSTDDTNVGLIVSSGGFDSSLQGTTQSAKVSTEQIAVTALDALGLDPKQLKGAVAEQTKALPGITGNDDKGGDRGDDNGDDKGEGRNNRGKDRNVIIFVADGLRPGSINPTDAPTLSSIRQNGVSFTNSHSLFPTFTTPNASAIATGHYLGDTGDFSNTVYTGFPVPNANGNVTPFIENDPVLADINSKIDRADPDSFRFHNFLNEESLLAFARTHGYDTAAIGKLGPVAIQDVSQDNRTGGTASPNIIPKTVIIDDSTNGVTPPNSPTTGSQTAIPLSPAITGRLTADGLATIPTTRVQPSGNLTTPGTLNANVDQQKYFADATTKAVLPQFVDDLSNKTSKGFAAVYWSRDPDGTQHNNGDAFNAADPGNNSLTVGINGPTPKKAVANADANLKQIIDYLKATDDPAHPGKKLYDNTDIFVTADHGFSTISKQAVGVKFDAAGTPTYTNTTSYAASQTYAGVHAGFLPPGFVAIDLAKDLGAKLYDPDKNTVAPLDINNVQYAAVDPTQGQRPTFGNGVIGGNGSVLNGAIDSNTQVIVAANGGSDLLYVPSKDKTLVAKIVSLLASKDYISGIFTDDSFGNIPGALKLSSIGLKGSADLPTPSIVINFKTFSTNPKNPNDPQAQVEVADTTLQQGQGMHGSFGRGDTFNNMAAIGPDFKAGYVDKAPVSNADITPTLARILGWKIPSVGDLVGRVAKEALVGGPKSVDFSSSIKTSTPVNGKSTVLDVQTVGNNKYFTAGGFAGGTVGLVTKNNSSTSESEEEDRKDSITGNKGNFTYDVSNENPDTLISNFVSGVDRITVDRLSVDGGLTVGNLPESEFISGTGVSAATNSTQRFIYDTTSGTLLFDPDGSGSLSSSVIATLIGAPALTNTDIVVL